MARAPVSKTGGWGFESLHSCQRPENSLAFSIGETSGTGRCDQRGREHAKDDSKPSHCQHRPPPFSRRRPIARMAAQQQRRPPTAQPCDLPPAA